MKILVAQEAGFCFGVKRAADMTLAAAATGETVQTYGELIHNPDFVAHLAGKGVTIANAPSEVNAQNVVIRAHGLPQETERELAQCGAKIIDATCPFVKAVQRRAGECAREGYAVILLGEATHPEILGIKSYAPEAVVVTEASQIPAFPHDTKIAFLSQTTQSLARFDEIACHLAERYADVKVIKTICNATDTKQREAEELAQKVDLMIVIGGKKSSNTTRLREVCEKHTRSEHIENASEIDPSWFAGFTDASTVGVTAGASTPGYVIDAVVARLEEVG